MATAVKGIIETIYDGAKEAKKALKKPLVIKSMKRKFQAAYDDAERIIDEAEIAKMDEYEKFEKVDVNVILSATANIKAANELRTNIEVEYKVLFDEKIG
jgi:hypothetical protein